LDMFAEMRLFADREKSATPEDILRMATVNGARALGLARKTGELAANAFADLITLPCPSKTKHPYEAALNHDGNVTASLIEGRWAFNGSGLLIWGDDKNYIRLERARMHIPNGAWRCWANWELRQNAKASGGWNGNNATLLEEAKTVTLRVVRKGDTFTGSYRLDGGAWQELAPMHVPLGKKLQVGVVALQNTAAGYEATFEALRITLVPASGQK